MNALVLAKRRAALRQRDEGAVMFIVAMTIAVLASVGVYALAAAATEVRTSGNERQNTQTHYLAEYGILGAAREMAGTRAQFTLTQMEQPPPNGRDTDCVSLQGVPSTAPATVLACKRWGSLELGGTAPWKGNASIQMPYGTNNTAQPYTANIPPGSFGSTPMDADFFVEFTEPMQLSGPAKFSTNSNTCFVQVSATSVGYTRPFFPNAANATTTQYGSEGVETQRARLAVGPLTPCPI
jgi:Tfp pilus assembly protein PilX